MSKNNPIPAEVFPLGEFIADELEARGQTVEQLCNGTVMPVETVQRLIAEPGFFLSLREAEWLGATLGVSPATLLNLQLAWRKRWKDQQR